MRPFSGSQEVFSWLSGFIDFERGLSAKTFRLDRMGLLAELAGHPECCAPVVHVAGSKGKGSVTTMISAMLHEAGLRTGRYISPHVTEYRERVSLADRFFDESIYAAAGNELRSVVETANRRHPQLFDPEAPEGESPTFFELLTLYFFLCCRLARCEVMVVETGMGGRLDATNIVDPLLSVITPIELEHTQYLGTTLEAIAGEKAGIIKPGRPLVLSEQPEEALRVFRRVAQEGGAPLWYIPELAEIENLQLTRSGTSFNINLNKDNPNTPIIYGNQNFRPTIKLSLVGAIQAMNALQALTAVRLAFPFIPEETLLRGLQKTTVPARFERVSAKPDVIIDGAHTPRSVSLCAETFVTLYGSGNLLLFGCAADKDSAAMARILIPYFSHIVITKPGNFKKSDIDKTIKCFTEAKDGFTVIIEPVPETAEALRRIYSLARGKNIPLLVTGSFYLAAEFRSFIAS